MIATSPSVRAFCVGQAKSGTASIATLLRRNYRAAHEPEREATLDLVVARERGDYRDEGFAEILRDRDQRLGIEYDIAWANQFVVEDLVAVFPDSRFVVLLRDPYSWLQSVIGHLLSRDVPADVTTFLEWWFRPDQHPPEAEDAELIDHGLYAVTAYLAAWNRHIERCMAAIPPDRRLLLRTHELKESHAALADFLGIPVETLDLEKGHRNRSTWSQRLADLVDMDYVDGRVASVSGQHLTRYFPEIRGYADSVDLWASI